MANCQILGLSTSLVPAYLPQGRGLLRSHTAIDRKFNAFGLFSKKLSLKASFLLLDSDLESSRQLTLLKNMMIDYLKA
ncbi:hypothetical protein EJP77_10860 [Paenibacillus zeisoli]|uniref:Uncharacterized protein n=1 Tax=Paenibacillus zeisoli TaxID=2496267 RepID=A0A3S1B7V2_9BACL|nr:hypothetical protein [Paenibacillus zeisoli]RUT31872.1 hypothetical protein EJP77_10860 [Paenibacillus zeisoli]